MLLAMSFLHNSVQYNLVLRGVFYAFSFYADNFLMTKIFIQSIILFEILDTKYKI